MYQESKFGFDCVFVWDFPHLVNASEIYLFIYFLFIYLFVCLFIYLFIYLFICPREQNVCQVVSTWRVDWVPLAEG